MLVLVKWLDIIGEDQNPWSTVEEAKAMKPAPISTIGEVVEDTAEFLTVASSWDESGEFLGNLNCIPKGVIREVFEINLRCSGKENQV
tara:strand:- start:109 stop:372 length:264 start_codon:yes stop_codon:yes gene_type:complete